MEDTNNQQTQQNQQAQQNAQLQQQQQQQQQQQHQQHQQQAQQNQLQQEGRQSSRKRITKAPPDASNPGSNKRPSGNGGGNNNDQPPIPERTSSFPEGTTEAKKSSKRKGRSGSTPNTNTNEDSGAALTASEILRMGGADLPEDDGTNQSGGAGIHDDGEDSEATEFGEGSEAFDEASGPAATPPPEQAPSSFAARKGKGKDKDSKRKGGNGKKNKDKGVSGQDGKQSASEAGGGNGGNGGNNSGNGGNGGGSGKQEGKRNDNGGGGDENLGDYSFGTPRFIEEDMCSDEDGHGHEGHDHGDYHDFDHNHGHGHGHSHNHEGGDDSNVINLNNFPTNSRGPNDGRQQNNNSSASSAFASITHTLAGMVPLPRAPREDYMRTMTNDRRSLQETVQSLIVTLQHEQMRRMAAEDNISVLQENLTVYKDLANQYRDEANKLREETERSKKGHMQVLRDLNRFKAGQGFSQMADDFLTQKARELRQDIRDFAIQYFDGEFEDAAKNERPPARAETKLGEFMAGISPLDPFQSFLASPTRCSSAVESFLWVILAKTVFGGWYWAGGGRLPLHDVFAWMRPVDFSFAVYNDETSDSKDANGGLADPEAERRFYTWRATTAKLVSERPGIAVRDNLRNKLVEEICMTIEPYLRAANDGSHAEELHNIINKAIEFDRDTSQQASRLEWIFCRHPGQKDRGEPQRFNPNVMDIQMWEETPTDQSEVLLVVAPGLRKRGRSNGEDYSVETMLLKMDVTCDPVTDMVVG
ncbi:hypothetical protein Sste5346_003644 [Sporothrix stenoceras]|uniref:Uncharacterized protein n=1 Tax=Sporothrix stenoceras TaxID=5173 RepID=A0ABR3ZC29_9PEZI